MFSSEKYPVFKEYPPFEHPDPVSDVGTSGPPDPEFEGPGVLSRLHANGDLFVLSEGEWLQVGVSDVRFTPLN